MDTEDNGVLTKCKVVITKFVNGVIIHLGPNIKFLCCTCNTYNFLDNYPTSFCSSWILCYSPTYQLPLAALRALNHKRTKLARN